MRWLFLCVFANAFRPKLCIHCKYFIQNQVGPNFGTCMLFPRTEFHITDKIHVEEYRYCSTARKDEELCGKDGKYFVDLNTFNGLY
jgi:hypothetical protein